MYKVTVVMVQTAELEIDEMSAEAAKKVAEWGVAKGYVTLKPMITAFSAEEVKKA